MSEQDADDLAEWITDRHEELATMMDITTSFKEAARRLKEQTKDD